MRQRTDRILIADPTPKMGTIIEPVRPLSVSGEIWVGDRAQDVPVASPRQRVIVRRNRRYFG